MEREGGRQAGREGEGGRERKRKRERMRETTDKSSKNRLGELRRKIHSE